MAVSPSRSLRRFLIVPCICVPRLRWIAPDSVLPNPLPWWKQSTWSVPPVMRTSVGLLQRVTVKVFRLQCIKWIRDLRDDSSTCCDSCFFLRVLFSSPVLLKEHLLSPILDSVSPDLCYAGKQYIKRLPCKSVSVYLLACLSKERFRYLSPPEHCLGDLGRFKMEEFREQTAEEVGGRTAQRR